MDRLGIDARAVEILGVKVPHMLLPVSPGRNLSTLVETAVRVHLLRVRGYNAAQALVARHAELIETANEGADRQRPAGDGDDAVNERVADDGQEKARR